GADRGGCQNAAAHQPAVQPLAGAGQPSGDGALLPAELGGGLGLGQPFQAAQQQRQAGLLPPAAYLLQDRPPQLRRRRRRGRVGRRGGRGHRLGAAGPLAEQRRRAAGDAEQPARQRGAAADRGGLAGQDQEGGLEGVLGVLLAVQQAAADAPDE